LRVRNLFETDSKGSKGATDRPSRTTARSEDEILDRTAGLSLSVPWGKRIKRGSFLIYKPPEGAW